MMDAYKRLIDLYTSSKNFRLVKLPEWRNFMKTVYHEHVTTRTRMPEIRQMVINHLTPDTIEDFKRLSAFGLSRKQIGKLLNLDYKDTVRLLKERGISECTSIVVQVESGYNDMYLYDFDDIAELMN